MTLSKLLSKYKDKEIIEALTVLYPDQKNNAKDGYKLALKTLRILIPIKPSGYDIKIEKHEEEETWYEVSGIKKTDTNKEYVIISVPWSIWLGSEVDLKEIADLDAIAICLYEMTYLGFDEKTVRENRDKLFPTIFKKNEVK